MAYINLLVQHNERVEQNHVCQDEPLLKLSEEGILFTRDTWHAKYG